MKSNRIAKREQTWYGVSIGILMLDTSYPCIPGNVGNASTFDFPVRYEKVEGASIDRLLNRQDATLAKPFASAARNLQHAGVKAITGACGFMALFQQEVAASVNIPVFLLSLLQISLIYKITGKKVGIITANATCLTEKHFENTGVLPECPIATAGMENQPEFKSAVNLLVFAFITMINFIHSALVRLPFIGFM
jgi:hypothetical protein